MLQMVRQMVYIYTTDDAGTDAVIEDDDEKVDASSDDGVDEAN